MPEHYPKNTVEASAWCKKCHKNTQHRIDGGRRGPCIPCMKKPLPPKREPPAEQILLSEIIEEHQPEPLVEVEKEREVPNNEHAERTILGAIILDGRKLEAVSMLNSEDFFLASHRDVYACMKEMAEQGHEIDLITLAESMGSRVQSVGGYAYLASLTEGLPIRPAIRDYVRIVKGKALLRRLISSCMNAVEKAYEGIPGMAIIASLKDQIEDIELDVRTSFKKEDSCLPK